MKDDDALPRVRKPTEAQQADIDAMQAEMGQRFDPSGRRFDTANALLTELNAIPREDWSPRQFSNYVDALVMLGEFDVAYELTKDKKYKQIWDAIEGKTKKECKCRDWESTEMVDGKPAQVKHSRFFVKQEIWNVKTGSMSKIITCNVCGRSHIE
jgi:hypothetical protein